jgi:hypothetical protein
MPNEIGQLPAKQSRLFQDVGLIINCAGFIHAAHQ